MSVEGICCGGTEVELGIGSGVHRGTPSQRPELVLPSEPVPIAIGFAVEHVDEGMLISPPSGVVHFRPSGKLIPSPICMSMH